MELIALNVNKVLLLDNYCFQDPYNNIDFLNQKASKSNNLDMQLSLIKLAAKKIEKFHSFFHFDQSFFHLQLALHYLKKDMSAEGIEQLELAIFQDHCNEQALELKQYKISTKIYKRVFEKFEDYLNFATDEKIDQVQAEGYWSDFEIYKNLQDPEILKDIINKIKQHHLKYHQEAAKLYLNRAIIFYYTNELDLAKNDLRKASYLDSQIAARDYYFRVAESLFFTT